MGTKKKNNTAVKDEQDFAADILAEELQGVLKSVPDQNADDFFNSLKDEMLEEGVLIEDSVVYEVKEEKDDDDDSIPEFTNIDIVPESLKEQISIEKKKKLAAKLEAKVKAKGKKQPELKIEPEDEIDSDDEKTKVDEPLNAKDFEREFLDEDSQIQDSSVVTKIEVVEDFLKPVDEVDEDSEISPEEVDATVDEIFGKATAVPNATKSEAKKPARVFDDKTSAIQEFPDVTAMTSEDKTQDLSSLENVSSMGSHKAEMLHQSAKRNPAIDLKNADYIKFAQGKIKNLEKELSNLRIETQELAMAGSHFKALADEREQRNKSLEARISEVQSTAIEEKKILNAALEAKETKISLLLERVESLEVELESKYNRLRVRERELESRLEILKQEQDAVASSKDDLILRVKKQNNALVSDLERARAQSQKSSTQLQEKEDALRRTIKALKLSLTMLESQKQN